MTTQRIFLCIINTAILMLLIGCIGAHKPYKISPDYNKQKYYLKTIAFYPMYYSVDGRDERRFGTYFDDQLYDAANKMSCNWPTRFVSPDSTVSIFEAAGDCNHYRPKRSRGFYRSANQRFSKVFPSLEGIRRS